MANLWTFKRPTSPGWYLMNRGDVVTPENFDAVKIEFNPPGYPDQLILRDIEGDWIPVEKIDPSFKWLEIDISALNKIGNAE